MNYPVYNFKILKHVASFLNCILNYCNIADMGIFNTCKILETLYAIEQM
jgi:hypothetical protein